MRMTGYEVRLRAWFRRDGQQWIAWCPALDVMTQFRTRKGALESLREAVELWFDSRNSPMASPVSFAIRRSRSGEISRPEWKGTVVLLASGFRNCL